MEDPKFRPMFVILPDEVMNEWAEWLAKKSFDLTATGIVSVELPAKQLGLIQACTRGQPSIGFILFATASGFPKALGPTWAPCTMTGPG